jgi:3',5'-cyclic AMP phosphodiesterase CpdA
MAKEAFQKGDRHMGRRRARICSILLLAGIIASASVAGPPGGDNGRSFSFVFMTDIHLMPERRGAEGFKAAIGKVNELAPDFVITGGDLIYDALETGYQRADSLYDLYGELCTLFRMPVHNTIGNHEVFGLYVESGVDPGHPLFGKRMFEERLGGGTTSSSFDHGGWHFILLDTIGYTGARGYFGHVSPGTLAWLAADLGKTDIGAPIVLCVHIPLVSPTIQTIYGTTETVPPPEMVTNAPEVLSLFEGRDLRLVLQGHLHIVEQAQVKGTKFVTGGAVSGSWWEGPFRGFPEGFVMVQVDGDVINYHYETYGWKAAGGPEPADSEESSR